MLTAPSTPTADIVRLIDSIQSDLERLRVWRGSYVTERLIGGVATVRAFIDWADRHCDVSALHGLRLAEAHFSPHSVMRVARQASEAADLCRRLGESGLGLLGGERLGLVRGFVTSGGPGPSQRLVEGSGSRHVRHTERDQAHSLLHTPNGFRSVVYQASPGRQSIDATTAGCCEWSGPFTIRRSEYGRHSHARTRYAAGRPMLPTATSMSRT